MTVAPLIAMKSTKCESLEAVGKELDRRAHTYANDVDQSGRHIGYCCRADDAHPLPLDKAVERRMGERRLSDVRMQVDEETDRLECLRQRAGGVARDVAELEPIAADVRRFEGAGRAERGAILDSIAARCAGAARAARAAIEELGDRIWALMRPKKAQRTERSLDDVMREATEVARAEKALSRNHVAPTNSRQRGQAR